MYTFVRTVSGMPGKHAELWTFAHKVKAYAKEKCDFDMDFSTPIGGDPNRIAFISITPSLAEFEAVGTLLAADADYQKLIATVAANVIPGLVHEDLWRSL